MIQLMRLIAPVMSGVAIIGVPLIAFAFKGQEYAKDAQVSLDQARAIALQAVPGKITDEELEKERGGSGLRYSFDIKGESGLREVGVDAKTGGLLEDSAEGPNAD